MTAVLVSLTHWCVWIAEAIGRWIWPSTRINNTKPQKYAVSTTTNKLPNSCQKIAAIKIIGSVKLIFSSFCLILFENVYFSPVFGFFTIKSQKYAVSITANLVPDSCQKITVIKSIGSVKSMFFFVITFYFKTSFLFLCFFFEVKMFLLAASSNKPLICSVKKACLYFLFSLHQCGWFSFNLYNTHQTLSLQRQAASHKPLISNQVLRLITARHVLVKAW